MPRNDNPLSRSIDEEKFAAEKIRIGDNILGSIFLNKILRSL